MVIIMLIEKIVKEEAYRNQRMIQQYEQLLTMLPRGSLICRKNEYYYLKYREGGKLFDVYVGKSGTEIEKLRDQLQHRKHCLDMLSMLRQEQKKIAKVLEGLA